MHEGPKTIYAQIVDYIEAHIESGDWEPGHRLPSERAMAELRKKGLIVSVQGRGTYVKDPED